ncbi:MAG: tRNA lysidine(34) synthetase TilS [Dehalococcoidales bacterium]|nr:tRNA lysidine(34) synthetase TilS [Dehalococcoidales bacterium]
MHGKRVNKSSLGQNVLGFIRKHRLITPQHTLLVAVSGGQDSVCLLHILSGLQDELGIGLHVAHLDHRLRGTESEDDARYVAGLAKKLGIPVTIGRRDVRAYQKKHGISMEEASREVRYNFLSEVAKSIGTDRVAVAHTLDDHAETVLLHLIRGTGIRGLRGLKARNKWHYGDKNLAIVRPLLEVTRDETAAYCAEHRLPPRLDTTNLSLVPLRNRIRLELLPLMKRYNPQVVDALLRTARIADDDIAFLEEEASRLHQELAVKKGKTITLDKQSFLELPPSLQRHLLRLSIEALLGTLRDIEGRHIEEIMKALRKPAGKRLDLPYGLVFTVDYEQYVLGKEKAGPSPFSTLIEEYPIKTPGETIIPGWRIRTSIVKHNRMTKETDALTGFFDFDVAGKKLTVRPRRRGDRFQPLGMKTTKKIGEFMLDSRIPRRCRSGVPIVSSPGQIIWVVGYRIDERAKVTADTAKILAIEFKHR